MTDSKNSGLPTISPDIDYFAVLGLKVGTELKIVKKTYRKLAMKWHPDVNKDEGAEEKFKDINEAYIILTDNNLRIEYQKIWEAKIIQEERKNQMNEDQRRMRERLEQKEMMERKQERQLTEKEMIEQIKRSGGYDEIYRIQQQFEDDQRERMSDKYKIKKNFSKMVRVKWSSQGLTKKIVKSLFEKHFGDIDRIKKRKNKRKATIVFRTVDSAIDACLKSNETIGKSKFRIVPMKM